MATEAQHSETMSGAATSSEAAGIGGDAALILAALGRIETVVRDERAAFGRLRTALLDMAQAIARAKAVADSETAAAMLDEFEHRVDAMIEIAGGAPAEAAAPVPPPVTEPAAQAPESNEVPTVSGVVLRLGPGDAAPAAATADAPQPAEEAADKGPTVAMLTAMVEALNASMPAPEPAAEPPPVLQVAPEPWAEPAPAATTAHETALLASLEQMGVRPFPPPEEGTAVIFTPKSEPEPLPESPAPPEPAVTAPEQTVAQALLPAEAAPPVPEPAVTPEGELAAIPEPPPSSAEADFDPTDFLFGPEPEPDPAAFLLDPAPPPRVQEAAVLPQSEFVAMPLADESPFEVPTTEELKPQDLKREEAKAEESQPAAEAEMPAEPPPHDPLHALKAMSPNEKLALFS
jgi:hypothetical protein